MNVILDSREITLEKIFENHYQKNFTYQNLQIGDIQIKNENNDDISVFERKTINDLKSSLKDGRFSEQKARILSSNFVHKCYIFEGQCDEEFKSIFKQIIIRLQMKYNMLVFLTENIEDTYKLITTIVDKYEKDVTYYDCDKSQSASINYIDTVKLCKKENITPSLCFKLQLAQIPLISKTIANEIVTYYPTWKHLINVLESDVDAFKRNMTQCKMGKKKIESLMKHVLM